MRFVMRFDGGPGRSIRKTGSACVVCRFMACEASDCDIDCYRTIAPDAILFDQEGSSQFRGAPALALWVQGGTARRHVHKGYGRRTRRKRTRPFQEDWTL